MSYIKVGSRFVIAVLVLLSADCVLAGQEQTSVAGGRRTIEQLRRLLSSRTSRVPVQKALSAYPKLNGKQGSYSVDRNGKTEVKQTRMRTRVADADHLILQYDNVDGDRVGEVITFSQKEKLYRRWQVVDDQLVGEWVGIGDGDASVATDNRTRTNTISWTPLVESAIAMSAAGCISTDSITLDRFSGDIKFVRSTVKIVAGELQTREALTVRSPIGNFSDFEEPYQRLQAAKKKSKGSLWERITGKKKGTEYKFEEKNFVFQPPSPDYLEVDFSRINPAVTLGLRHRARGQHLLVIAERVEMLTVTKKAYSEVVRKLARSALPGATLTANSEREVNGLQFTTFATAVDKKTTRFYSTTTFGNYAYQIVTLTPNPAMAAGLEFHLNVLNGFELIDKSRSETPFLELDKPHFGFRTNVAALQDVGAQKAPADEDAGTEPILDLQFADGSILTAHAIDLEGVEIEDDNAIAILSNELGLKYPDNVIKSRPLRMGTANGSEVTFVVEFLSGERGTYMVRFLRNDEHLVMLATSIEAETGSHEKILHERLDAFEFYKPKPRANRKLSEKNAELVNVLGVQLYRMGQAAKSLALVKLACDRRPDNVVFRTNYVMMLQNSGESQTALDEIERALKRFPNEQKLLAAKTDSLNALRKYDQAFAVYEQLLKSKTFTEGDLYGYANTLLQVGRANDAVAAYETYLPRLDRPSINLRRGYCSMLQFAERFDDAIKLAEELQQEMPNSIELKEDLILAFVEARRAPDALSAAGKLIKAGQATANCLYLQGRAYLVERRFDKAKQSFEAGLKLAPGDSILQDAILSASAAMGEGDNSSIKEPLKPVEIPSIVQQKIESLPAFQPNDGFNYQFIERTSGIEFRKDQPVRRTEYNECLVHNQAGVDALQKLRFLFDPTYQQIYVNELQVIDESGKVTDQRNVSQFYVTSASQYGMATTEKYLNVPVSGLKPGHRLRYVFTKSDRLPSDSIPFTDTPFLASSPAGPRCVFVTGDIENLVSDQSDPAILNLADAETRAWILAETPILRMESRQPEGLGFVPKVWFGSNEQTWEGIGQAYLKRIRQPLEQVPAADKLAQSIVRSEDSDEQKARAVLRWIQDKMAYQSLEFGVHAQVPNAVDLTLRNRFGDCKDLSLLGLQMLRALKIRSHMCLVNTAGAIEKSAPDMAQFDHAILFLPDIGGGAFVDCTSRFVDPLRTGPAAWFGKDVLILDDNEIRFQAIQADAAHHSRIDSKRTVTLSADSNDVLVTESLTVDGGYATSLRSFLLGTNEANIKSYLAETLTDRNRVELVSYQSVNAEDFLKPLVLKLTYRIRKVVRVRGELRRVKLPGRWEEYLLRESVVSERLTPFELKVPLRFTSSVELKVPAGWKCETDPQTEADRNDWLDYRIERTEQGSSLKLESRIARKSGRYPASSFSPYQDSVNLAVDAVTPELVFSTSNP